MFGSIRGNRPDSDYAGSTSLVMAGGGPLGKRCREVYDAYWGSCVRSFALWGADWP